MTLTRNEYAKLWAANHPESRRETRKKYYEKNKEKLAEHKRQKRLLNLEYYKKLEKEKSAKWREKYPEKVKKNRRIRLLVSYNLTEESYQKMLLQQEGKCAICKKEMSYPNIDHSHITGKTRSLLCESCNPILGYVEKQMMINKDILKEFAKYLKTYSN